MKETTDHQDWVPVSIRMPNDGKLVALRTMEAESKRVHYAVGWYSAQKRDWVITARPRADESLEAIAWFALPK